MEIEKRKDLRFLAEDNVIIALQNGFKRIGRVKDVSRGGLSFEYIHDDESNDVGLEKNVFLWANEFSMSNIASQIVYDLPIPIPPEYGWLTIQFISRRCGIQFGMLEEKQIAQLDFFLKHFTKG